MIFRKKAMSNPVNNKVISLPEAVDLIAPNSTLALGGMTIYRRPVSFARGLVHRFERTGQPTNLTLLAFTAGIESDLLVGAGMVSRVRSCYFGLEIFGLAPMFTYLANRGEIEVVEETEASLAFGLRATLANVGFMPGRAWIGTDLPVLRPDVRTILDPYTGEELMAFPAIKPDVAVIHTLCSDVEGNSLIGGNKGVDEELHLAADLVILTTEEIVPPLDRADLVAPFVDAVVHAPRGASPTSCHPLYPVDGEAMLAYVERVGDPDSFKEYIEGLTDL
jgi:glutaconate CoA-transferase subunit A